MNSKNRFIFNQLLAFEYSLLNLVLIGYVFITHAEFSFNDPVFVKNLLRILLLYNAAWLLIILYLRDNEFYLNPDHSYFRTILVSLFFFLGIVTTPVFVFKLNYFPPETYIIPIFIFSFLDFISHGFILKYLKKKGSNLLSDTLLISSGDELAKLKSFRNFMAHHGYNIVGCLEGSKETHIDNRSERTINGYPIEISGEIKELPEVLSSNKIDEIFIATASLDTTQIAESINVADSHGIRVKLIPENPMMIAKNYKATTMGDLAVFKLRQSPLDNFNKNILKRLFDIFFALLVIILMSPIYLLIGLLVFLDTKGSIIYAPYRKGEGGKTFRCYKFRTMSVNDNPMNGTRSTVENDPRITSIGRILRMTDLDELPQFFNVLMGDMSVIGPRPHRINLQNDLRKQVNDYMVRSYVKPGITGWAQVNGWRGPTVTPEQKNERIRHDLWYIENWSFWLDIKIIFMTLFGKHRKQAF